MNLDTSKNIQVINRVEALAYSIRKTIDFLQEAEKELTEIQKEIYNTQEDNNA